jgi:hypothetical protein
VTGEDFFDALGLVRVEGGNAGGRQDLLDLRRKMAGVFEQALGTRWQSLLVYQGIAKDIFFEKVEVVRDRFWVGYFGSDFAYHWVGVLSFKGV